MSDFAEWRPCQLCGLPVALPARVHDECAEKVDAARESRCTSCGVRLTREEAGDGTLCSECMWADELAFLETAYLADLDDLYERTARGESHE